ncbi:MAG: nitrogen fixation protein [Planctomycetota bacterium]|nr:MAG: nitrogen fixation protein [Planctomycetota bacterium]
MKVAIASQNQRDVTGHAGRCTCFWIYSVQEGEVQGRELLEFGPGESIHDRGHEPGPGLMDCKALITQSMGPGLASRLAQRGMHAVCTEENDPEKALRAYLDGSLQPLPSSGDGGCGKH